jgi:hypothetical protein
MSARIRRWWGGDNAVAYSGSGASVEKDHCGRRGGNVVADFAGRAPVKKDLYGRRGGVSVEAGQRGTWRGREAV